MNSRPTKGGRAIIPIAADPEALARLQVILRENANIVRRFDPTLAAAQIVAADYLKTLAPAAPGEFRERLPKPKQEKIALNWIFDLLESWPKSERLPTSKQLLKLARSQIPGISRENVLSQRTPELTMLRGRPINSRKK